MKNRNYSWPNPWSPDDIIIACCYQAKAALGNQKQEFIALPSDCSIVYRILFTCKVTTISCGPLWYKTCCTLLGGRLMCLIT